MDKIYIFHVRESKILLHFVAFDHCEKCETSAALSLSLSFSFYLSRV